MEGYVNSAVGGIEGFHDHSHSTYLNGDKVNIEGTNYTIKDCHVLLWAGGDSHAPSGYVKLQDILNIVNVGGVT
jgi:hypothetical protein